MQLYDVFNGDADGLCSLHQLRLARPAESLLITGVKRDIELLSRVPSPSPSELPAEVNVFDISLDRNRKELLRILQAGARINYFDHHFAGEIPHHPLLETHIGTRPDAGTSFIVDQLIDGRFRAWAVAGTYGDNFDETAHQLARSVSMGEKTEMQLKELGILLNYNSYGTTTDDLIFHPARLYATMKEYENPIDFMNSSPVFDRLRKGYKEDMRRAASLTPSFSSGANHVFILPDKRWARRVSGVFANSVARTNPSGAHAVLTPLEGDGFVVSVRAPLSDRRDADTLCRKFPTGGGRAAAAGINVLPEGDVDKFLEEFEKTYK